MKQSSSASLLEPFLSRDALEMVNLPPAWIRMEVVCKVRVDEVENALG